MVHGALLVFAFAGLPAVAQRRDVQVRYVPPSEVASYARSVVRGTIEFRRTVPGPPDAESGLPGHVFTEIGLRVSEVWKGGEHRAGDLAVFRHTGGQWGEIHTVEGPIPEYRTGEEWVVAILPSEKGWWVAYGLMQGAFRVEGDAAKRSFDGLTFYDGTPPSLREEAFRIAELREAMAGRGPEPAPIEPPVAVPPVEPLRAEGTSASFPYPTPATPTSNAPALAAPAPVATREHDRPWWPLILAILMAAAAVWLLWRSFRPEVGRG